MALTMAQVYAYARQAGFDPASAVIATAIAMAESGLDPRSMGDTNLQDATWGPSVGLMQIRTLKRDTGTGRDRDITRLTDPVQNLAAAFHISSGGRDWGAWTVYNTGAYRQYMQQAIGAAAGAGRTIPGAVVSGDTGGQADTTTAPASVTTQPAALTGDVATVLKDTGVWLLLVAGGLVLVVAGVVHATGTGGLIRKAGGAAVKTAAKAALL